MLPHTSAGFAFTARCRIANEPGMLGRLTSRLGELGGDLRAIDIVRIESAYIIRDLTVLAASEQHAHSMVEALQHVEGIEVVEYSDRTFLAHLGGKISIESKIPLKTRDDLSMVYTPGVARICTAIAADPRRARNLTIKRNCVAIISDGTAVLGLGDLGPSAALPVLEGKAMLFKEFGGVDAFPIALDTREVDAIVATVKAIAPVFGGINLEDISAPRCFEVERRLREELDIPVFHDDQHGTAVVVVAALLNALRVTGRPVAEARVVVVGIGAAGTAVIRLLIAAGITDIVAVDKQGILNTGAPQQTNAQSDVAAGINPRGVGGGLRDALAGADVVIGTSTKGTLERADIDAMAAGSIVFALANPDPEINNVLCFPGFFRGLLDSGALTITDAMKLAAARAIAAIVPEDELQAEYIIPSVFNRAVAPAVAAAVRDEAERSGLSTRGPDAMDPLHQ